MCGLASGQERQASRSQQDGDSLLPAVLFEGAAMLRIEKIHCPVDFSEYSLKAFDYAQSLAQHYGAKLLLQHVIQPLSSNYPYYAFPDTINDVFWNLESSADQKLSELVTAHQKNGFEIRRFVHKGTVPDCILAFSEAQAADLIVMGTHGRHGFDHLTMGSVAEKVLRKAHCPVLVVRKPAHDFVNPADPSEPVRLKKMLYCTDFSEYSGRALTYALSLAMEYNAELTLLHVLEDVPSTDGLQESVADVTRRLEALAPPEAGDWCSIRTAVRIGKPYQQILQIALETDTDLVVMGVRGRNAVDLAVFGSTAHRVIQLGTSPVLAVHL